VIIRPSTLVRSNWADEGARCAVCVFSESPHVLWGCLNIVAYNMCFRIKVLGHGPVQRRAHDNTACQSFCQEQLRRRCRSRQQQLHGALRSNHPYSIQLSQQRLRDQAAIRSPLRPCNPSFSLVTPPSNVSYLSPNMHPLLSLDRSGLYQLILKTPLCALARAHARLRCSQA
jgi:hypothetical protein